MTRLNPKNNNSVNSDLEQGFKTLITFVLLAGVLGLSLRLYFSPSRLDEWVGQALARAHLKSKLKYAKVEAVFADGAWPRFGLKLIDVSWEGNSCEPIKSVVLDELQVPLRLAPLFRGQLGLGIVSAHGILIHVQTGRCGGRDAANSSKPGFNHPSIARAVASDEGKGSSGTGSSTSGSGAGVPAGSSTGSSAAGSASFSPKPFFPQQDLELVRDIVEGIDLNQVRLIDDNQARQYDIERVRVGFQANSAKVLVESDFYLPKELYDQEPKSLFHLSVNAEPTAVVFKINGHLNEGYIESSGDLSSGTTTEPLSVRADFIARTVPMSVLKKHFVRLGWLQETAQPKFMWLGCEASIAGPVDHLFEKAPLKIKGCELEGDLGHASLGATERLPSGKFSAFAAKFEHIDVLKVYNLAGVPEPSGVLAHFGFVDGEINSLNGQDLKLNIRWIGPEVFFSRRRVRGHQKIVTVSLQIERQANQGWRGSVDKIELVNGHAQGDLKFTLDQSLKNGAVDLGFTNLTFDPSIQKLMTGGEVLDLKVFGRLKLQQGEIEDFEGVIKANQVNTEQMQLNQGELRAKYGRVPKKFVFAFKSQTLSLTRDSNEYARFEPVLLGVNLNDENLNFTDFRGTIEVEPQKRAFWRDFGAKLFDGHVAVRSQGEYAINSTLNGQIELDFPKAKKLRWSISGTENSPNIKPESKALLKLLDSQAGAEALGLNLQSKATSEKQDKPDRLRSIGKSVLDKARAIVDKKKSTEPEGLTKASPKLQGTDPNN